MSVWDTAGPHTEAVIRWAGTRGGSTTSGGSWALSRSLTALLRLAARLMRCEACAPPLLAHLTLLYRLPYRLFYQQADVVSVYLCVCVKVE